MKDYQYWSIMASLMFILTYLPTHLVSQFIFFMLGIYCVYRLLLEVIE